MFYKIPLGLEIQFHWQSACLPSMHKALGSIPNTVQNQHGIYDYKPSTWEAEAGGHPPCINNSGKPGLHEALSQNNSNR